MLIGVRLLLNMLADVVSGSSCAYLLALVQHRAITGLGSSSAMRFGHGLLSRSPAWIQHPAARFSCVIACHCFFCFPHGSGRSYGLDL